jgi:hypothetical protein
MAISGKVSDSGNQSGTGSVEEQISATPPSCSVDGIRLNGDPEVNVSGQFELSERSPVWPVKGTETGAVTFGPIRREPASST